MDMLGRLERAAKADPSNRQARIRYETMYNRVHGETIYEVRVRLRILRGRRRRQEAASLIEEIVSDWEINEVQNEALNENQFLLFTSEPRDYVLEIMDELRSLAEDQGESLDWYPGYADSDEDINVIVADWNEEQERDPKTRYYVSVDDAMKRIGDALERHPGFETDWSDQINRCDGCYRAIGENNFYQAYFLVDSEIVCRRCFINDPSDTLEYMAQEFYPGPQLEEAYTDLLQENGWYLIFNNITHNELLNNYDVEFLIVDNGSIYSSQSQLISFLENNAFEADFEIPTQLNDPTDEEESDEMARISVGLLNILASEEDARHGWPENIDDLVDRVFE